MSRRSAVLAGAFASLLLAFPPAQAAGAGLVRISAGSGMPSGDFNDVAKGGTALAVAVSYQASSRIALGFDIGLFGADADSTGVEKLYSPGGDGAPYPVTLEESWSVIRTGAFARTTLPGRWNLVPNVRVGAGLYTVRFRQEVVGTPSALTLGGTEVVSVFGLNGGVGVDYQFARGVLLGAEIAYHRAFVEDAPVTFLTAGVSLGFGAGR